MQATVRTQLDYYALLQIAPTAGMAEIKVAFRRLALRYHPDHNPNPRATHQFQEVNEAHRILSNPVMRSEYDAKRQFQFVRQAVQGRAIVRSRRRRSFRRRPIRAMRLILAFILTVPGAWAVILGVMRAAHPPFEELVPAGQKLSIEQQFDNNLRFEMLAVSQNDTFRRRTAARGSDAHICGCGCDLIIPIPLELRQTSRSTFADIFLHTGFELSETVFPPASTAHAPSSAAGNCSW
jgi:curved DNA-binding protein CbpA